MRVQYKHLRSKWEYYNSTLGIGNWINRGRIRTESSKPRPEVFCSCCFLGETRKLPRQPSASARTCPKCSRRAPESPRWNRRKAVARSPALQQKSSLPHVACGLYYFPIRALLHNHSKKFRWVPQIFIRMFAPLDNFRKCVHVDIIFPIRDSFPSEPSFCSMRTFPLRISQQKIWSTTKIFHQIFSP